MSGKPSDARVGLWLIGAFGGVGTTIALGLSALRRGLTSSTALATEVAPFRALQFAGFEQFIVGGHDVRKSSFVESARELQEQSGVFAPTLTASCMPDLENWQAQVRPGIVRLSGRPIEAFADWSAGLPPEASDRALIERIADDWRAFQSAHGLQQLIVLNIASSEPMPASQQLPKRWQELAPQLAQPGPSCLPASSLYGLAAAEVGACYLNFTPSLGLDAPALEERAQESGILYMGRDGKTGETLMKAVLAPMFARRNLEILSWVGHNILGNRDGRVLQDPINKQGKIDSKGHLIGDILGYEPETLVSIEHISSMGDWKTAWDHIHFRGFLGTKMTLQFIWQGCDSLLAAPLAIDLARWAELACRRGETGCMRHLAAYFKSPMGVAEQDFFRQWDRLDAYAKAALSTPIR